jgi:hypothetical protein
LGQDRILTPMVPPPLHRVIGLHVGSSEIVGELVTGLVLNGAEVLERIEEVGCSSSVG